MKALEILTKTRAQLEDDHKFVQMYDEAIAELQISKTCSTCRRYHRWECADGSFLDVGDCDYDIRFGRELIDECYRGFVKDDFGCTEYQQKEI